MGKLTRRQQETIKYKLRDKFNRREKSDMVHSGNVPKYIQKRVPYIRRLSRNLDQVLIVASFKNPDLKTGLIDRLLVMAELEEIEAVICLNKADLLEDPAEGEKIAGLYRAIGYRVVITSAETKQGVEELRALLKGRRSALAGHSGVGKSSLLNAMHKDIQVAVGEVSYSNNKGRHTTTQVKTYTLDKDTELIDLPGLKHVDFFDIHRDEARFYFREFLDYADGCKFSNCLHLREKDCAVKEAVEEGRIARERYRSYEQFVASLE